MLDGMLMVSAMFHVREDLGSKPMSWSKTLVMNNMRIFWNLNGFVKKKSLINFLHWNHFFKIKKLFGNEMLNMKTYYGSFKRDIYIYIYIYNHI